jgi:hypothetical protein
MMIYEPLSPPYVSIALSTIGGENEFALTTPILSALL